MSRGENVPQRRYALVAGAKIWALFGIVLRRFFIKEKHLRFVMASMEYDESFAERLEAVYLGPDVVAQRKDTLKRLAVANGESVLDIGSGPGFLAADLAKATGPMGKVVGVDISKQMVERARARNTNSWVSYEVADAEALPFEDESFDVIVSTQVAEYVPDIDAFCSEVFRVLKSSGRGLILATDWDAVCWHSEDPERMKRVLKAFAPHCADSSLPRTLAARLRRAGLRLEDVSYFPIINVDRYEGCYGAGILPFIKAYIGGQGTMPEAELEGWAAEQSALNNRGEHFFSTGRFSFEVSKP